MRTGNIYPEKDPGIEKVPVNGRTGRSLRYRPPDVSGFAPVRSVSMNKTERSPLVSVVVPVYNTEPWLEECLESITRQTLHDIEIICVNDGSTDRSAEILGTKANADNRVRIINQVNSGLSEARNAGARAASGEYLYFMDSDDTLEPDALEVCTEYMTRRDLEYVCFNMAAFGEEPETAKYAGEFNYRYFKRILDNEKVYTGQELFADLKKRGAYIAPAQSCMLRRRAFLEHDLWFHPGILHEDEPWMLTVLMSLTRCGCVNRILYRYRIRSNSIVQTAASFARVYGLLAGIQDVKQLIQNPQNKPVSEYLTEHMSRLQKKAVKEYTLCSKEEQRKLEELNPGERFLFEQSVVYPASLTDRINQRDNENKELRDERNALKKENRQIRQERDLLKQEKKKLQKDMKRVVRSETWRIGRIITWFPRKTKKWLSKIFWKQNDPEKTKASGCIPENRISIFPSEVSGNHVVFHYSVSGEWASCFSTKEPFEVTYPFAMENIPESIRIIPFLSQVIPVSWVCDAEIRVPVCDRDFYDCLEKVKAGYRKMYPMISFGGKLTVDSLEDNRKQEREEKALACWSGGVDSFTTVISHLAEQPLLVSLWGSDVPWDDAEEWGILEKQLRDGAKMLGLEQVTVRTSFRRLLYESVLGKLVRESGDGWWHGFQHGIGILGHLAPVAWHENIGNVYIASSNTAEYPYTCASDPTIDNFVRFCGAKVIHDGYDLDRQSKIKRIVDFCTEKKLQIPLHVCWEKTDGYNCCHCEKCWRTMLGLYAEGADPKRYGFSLFDGFEGFSGDIEQDFHRFRKLTVANYMPIQKKLRERSTTEVIPQELSWLIKTDLSSIENGSLRLYKGKLVKPVWLLGTPDYNNLGDQSIAEEERAFLQNVFPEREVMEVSVQELVSGKYARLEEIGSTQAVFLQGGGNIGTLWPKEENVRRKVINTLNDNRVVIFPQSIWFSGDEKGAEALRKAEETYKGNKILLCCRDIISYRFAQEHFACRSILVPDMVLWESRTKGNQRERFGAMTLLRQDIERKLSDEDQAVIESILTERFRSIDSFDTVLRKGKVTRENRTEKIDDLICRISGAECVVTDRLHGMILCAVTGTPCVALGNSYHKVEAFYGWLKSLGYIRFIHRTDELADAVDEVCSCTERIYPENEMREQFGELIRSIAGP